MRKIKFKVKHIIIALIILFMLIPTLLYAAGTSLYNSESEFLRIYSNIFLNLYTGLKKPSFFDGEVYFKQGENTFNLSRNRIFIRTDGAYSYPEEARSREYFYKAIEYYNKGMSMGEDDKYYNLNYNRAIALYTLMGENERVEALIDQGLKSKNDKVRLNAARNRIAFDIKKGLYSQALERCNSFLEIWKDDYKLHIFRGDLYFLLGDMERAKNDYKVNMEPVELNVKREAGYIDYPSGDRNELIRDRSNADGSGIIKGRVTNGDKPIHYAFIALQGKNSEINGDTMILSNSNSAGFGFTDDQGFYEIRNVPEGSYYLRIVVPGLDVENVSMVEDINPFIEVFNSRITKKNIEFKPFMKILKSGISERDEDFFYVEWEPVKDAVKYIVSLEISGEDNYEEKSGVTMSYEYITVTENRINLNLDSLSRILFYPVVKNDGQPTTESYIGYVDGRELGINIRAMDKDGRTISKTNRDSNPKIKMKKRELNTGEKLILKKKFVEGKEWFEDQLRNNPEDKNSLYNLIRIYSIGINEKYKDRERAKEYAERIYKLNGDQNEYERIIKIIMIKDF